MADSLRQPDAISLQSRKERSLISVRTSSSASEQHSDIVTPVSSAEQEGSPQRKRHVVVFSADGEIEIPIYKFADGRFCPTWYDPSTGALARRPKKLLSDAISIARGVCCVLWETKGLGLRDECRVLVQEPRRSYQRKSNLFSSSTLGQDKPVLFNPGEHGWRPLLIRLVCGTELTSAQKVLVFYIWDRAHMSGQFYESKKRTAKDTKISLPHLRKIVCELVRGGWLIKQRGNESEIARYSLSLPPTLHAKLLEQKEEMIRRGGGTKLPPTGKTKLPAEGETLFHAGGNSVSPEPSNELQDTKTSNRALSRAREEELLGELRCILPESEMRNNGGCWRKRCRVFETRRSVEWTIEDYKVRTPSQRDEIKNLPAWFNDRYTRNLVLPSTGGAQIRESNNQERRQTNGKSNSGSGTSRNAWVTEESAFTQYRAG